MPDQIVVTSAMPFPPVSWWMQLAHAGTVIVDTGEQYQKMSFRNKYSISGANNIIQLSVPLVKGRNQRTPVGNVAIHNAERWQIQHWRALTSAYRRTPYWEYYEPLLQSLYEQKFDRLADFNIATINWVVRQLKMPLIVTEVSTTVHEVPAIDLRNYQAPDGTNFPHYYQVFEDRIGFIPDLCIIDLMCAEGPATLQWLRNNNITAVAR
jgi:hypothetical protein